MVCSDISFQYHSHLELIVDPKNLTAGLDHRLYVKTGVLVPLFWTICLGRRRRQQGVLLLLVAVGSSVGRGAGGEEKRRIVLLQVASDEGSLRKWL